MKKILESVEKISNGDILKESEYLEILRLLEQARVHSGQKGLIKRVFNEMSDNGASPTFGSIAVYELGRIHGIRAERDRRKRGSEVNQSIAV